VDAPLIGAWIVATVPDVETARGAPVDDSRANVAGVADPSEKMRAPGPFPTVAPGGTIIRDTVADGDAARRSPFVAFADVEVTIIAMT
jgi:hypothetical protein